MFFAMIVFAFYSKSIGGLIMLGPLGVIWLLSPMRKILLSKSFLLGSFLSLLICSFYYLTRESIQHGFINLAWHSEYLRMFSNVMPWHEHGFGYYFKNFVSLHTYSPWIFFLIGAMAYALLILKEKSVKEDLLRWMIISLGYLLFISIPADKLEWYDAPVFPFFAMILGVTAGQLTEYIPRQWRLLWVLPIIFILWRKLNFIRNDINPRDPLEYEGAILRQLHDLDSIKVFMPVATSEHRLQLDFYRKVILAKTGEDIKVLDSVDDISVNDHIIICQTENLKNIEGKYLIDTIKTWSDLGYEIRILQYR
jgi:hypothetical protein